MHHSRNFTTLETYDPASRRVQSPTRERRYGLPRSGDCSAPGGVTRMAAGNLAVLKGIVMGRRSLRFALLVLSGGLVVASQSPIQAGQVSQGGPGAQVKKAYKTPRTPWG